jgi:hypothetical protein
MPSTLPRRHALRQAVTKDVVGVYSPELKLGEQ